MRGIKGYYESFHGIKIPDYTVQLAVTLSERYITDRFLPDKAIDLLDEASSHLALASPVIKETEELAAELASVRSEREALESESGGEGPADEQRYARIAELRTREIGMQERFDRLSAERDAISLSVSDLADVVEIWTGIPAKHHYRARVRTHRYARRPSARAYHRSGRGCRCRRSRHQAQPRGSQRKAQAGFVHIRRQHRCRKRPSWSSALQRTSLIRPRRLSASICPSLWRSIRSPASSVRLPDMSAMTTRDSSPRRYAASRIR